MILGTLLGGYLLIAIFVATICFFERRKGEYPITWIESFIMDGLMWPITVFIND